MAGAIVVEEAGRAAVHPLAALEVSSFEAPWSAAAVGALIADGLTRAWVARLADEVVGGALVRVVAGEGELLRIAVRPEARRDGIGRVLLDAVLSAIADACPLGVHLEVRASNVAARHLYTRAGFIERGRRRDYYQAPREDAILMHWRPTAAVVDEP
jgi:ribosomal-protein-alanine N-acetyltransferase